MAGQPPTGSWRRGHKTRHLLLRCLAALEETCTHPACTLVSRLGSNQSLQACETNFKLPNGRLGRIPSLVYSGRWRSQVRTRNPTLREGTCRWCSAESTAAGPIWPLGPSKRRWRRSRPSSRKTRTNYAGLRIQSSAAPPKCSPLLPTLGVTMRREKGRRPLNKRLLTCPRESTITAPSWMSWSSTIRNTSLSPGEP